MKAVAWKMGKSKDKLIYVVQVDNVKGIRNENKLLKELKEWQHYGEGYDVKQKCKTLMFKHHFETEDEWKSWARSFPYELVEVGKSGKEKPYKLGLAYQNSRYRRTGNGK